MGSYFEWPQASLGRKEVKKVSTLVSYLGKLQYHIIIIFKNIDTEINFDHVIISVHYFLAVIPVGYDPLLDQAGMTLICLAMQCIALP